MVKLKIILRVVVYLLIRFDILADWLVLRVSVCVVCVCAKDIYSGDSNKLVTLFFALKCYFFNATSF